MSAILAILSKLATILSSALGIFKIFERFIPSKLQKRRKVVKDSAAAIRKGKTGDTSDMEDIINS